MLGGLSLTASNRRYTTLMSARCTMGGGAAGSRRKGYLVRRGLPQGAPASAGRGGGGESTAAAVCNQPLLACMVVGRQRRCTGARGRLRSSPSREGEQQQESGLRGSGQRAQVDGLTRERARGGDLGGGGGGGGGGGQRSRTFPRRETQQTKEATGSMTGRGSEEHTSLLFMTFERTTKMCGACGFLARN